MTKSELIERLHIRYPRLTALQIEQSVKIILEKISQSLEKGNRVEIRGFGSFSLHFRPERTGRNPKTGNKVNVAAKSTPYFRPGKGLRDKVDASMNER